MLYNIKLFDLIEYCKLSNINWKISIYFVSRNNAKLIFLSQASYILFKLLLVIYNFEMEWVEV